MVRRRPQNQISPVERWIGSKSAHVAIVFTDLVGSTRNEIELGGEQYGRIRRVHFDSGDALIKKFGGFGVKKMGDAFMALFRTALDALDFCLALRAQPGHAELRVRAGIHVGLVTEDCGDVYSSAVSFASRVVSAAKSDEIYLSEHAKRDIDQQKPARLAHLPVGRMATSTEMA